MIIWEQCKDLRGAEPRGDLYNIVDRKGKICVVVVEEGRCYKNVAVKD